MDFVKGSMHDTDICRLALCWGLCLILAASDTVPNFGGINCHKTSLCQIMLLWPCVQNGEDTSSLRTKFSKGLGSCLQYMLVHLGQEQSWAQRVVNLGRFADVTCSVEHVEYIDCGGTGLRAGG